MSRPRPASDAVGHPGIGGRVADWLEIPPDVLLDLPRITLMGNVHVTIENHRGLVRISPEVIEVATLPGRILIEGKNLAIRLLHRDELTVTGEIHWVRYADATGGDGRRA